MWSSRNGFCLKAAGHRSHLNGFSPVWFRIWTCSMVEDKYVNYSLMLLPPPLLFFYSITRAQLSIYFFPIILIHKNLSRLCQTHWEIQISVHRYKSFEGKLVALELLLSRKNLNANLSIDGNCQTHFLKYFLASVKSNIIVHSINPN